VSSYSSFEFTLFAVYFDEDRTRVDTDGDLMGAGFQLPTGTCYVWWHLEAYPPEDRLDHEHVSRYGSIADVEQGTGGVVETVATHEVDDA